MSVTIDSLITAAQSYGCCMNDSRIREAYAFAVKAHEGQIRKSGGPYVNHPLEVAIMLTRYKAGEDTLIAALLHDVAEDTERGIDDIEELFGPYVAKLVDGVTKLPRVNISQGKDNNGKFSSSMEAELQRLSIESLRKMLEVMRDDVRVVVIKLLDRLHNMQSLSSFRRDKQVRIARETLDTYVKIARWLCIKELAEELCEVSQSYLYPEAYARLQELRTVTVPFEHLKEEVTATIKNSSLGVLVSDIVIREYTDYDSVFAEEASLLSRKINVFVILPTEADCYTALHTIHSLWRRQQGSFRDYINTPRHNGFRGIVSWMIRDDDVQLQVMLMTREMYEYARRGVTLVCFSGKPVPVHLDWIDELRAADLGTRDRSMDFKEHLEKDILSEKIVVHGAGGTVYALPSRSTALDAVFLCCGKKVYRLNRIFVNGKSVPFHHPVHDTDHVRAEFCDDVSIRHEWLGFVDTVQARALITEYFDEFSDEELGKLGKSLLDEALTKRGMAYPEEFEESDLLPVLQAHGHQSLHDLYLHIARGTVLSDEAASYFGGKLQWMQKKTYELRFAVSGEVEQQDDIIRNVLGILSEYRHVTHSFSVRMKNKLSHAMVSLSLAEEDISQLTRLVKRIPEVNWVTIRPRFFHKTAGLIVIMLALLWGLDPVFASLLLSKTPVTPYAFTVIRFVSLTAVSGLSVLAMHLFTKHKYSSFAFFKPSFLLSGLFLFLTAFSLYLLLDCGITPLEYIAVGVFMSYILGLFQESKVLQHLSYFGIASVSLVLIFAPDFGMKHLFGYIFTLLSTLSFSLYTYWSGRFQDEQKIRFRHFGFLFKCHLLVTLFSLSIFPFFSWPLLGADTYLVVIGFSLIFNLAPYLLYSIIVNRFGYATFFSHRMSFVLVAPLVAEFIILGLPFSWLKVFGVGILILGSTWYILLRQRLLLCLQSSSSDK